ncbi:MarR family winged helix-turn-helix transcriptional regulator [Streptomyces halobius]|uniref:MarR family winged helix-turn-helix transcriptional regulator n=1 Tax=Streptomyces halobius TaxID=2879846 RepID=A0ABY4MH74_9ACTN|nr:MarR family winged helix-turn-helix transcriptional regulator [Streptomyces halobius]UQA95755.1 MarR family winged helix-turn-helix transcriptional regulator [Streptomyces halobius]
MSVDEVDVQTDAATVTATEAAADTERDAGAASPVDPCADGAAGPAPTEELLYSVIRRLWPLHRTIVRAVERELAGTGMTAGEHALLDALRTEGPRTVPQLARILELDRQPVQRWVNHAAELGLVVAATNPAHRRSSLIKLTAEGDELIRGVQEFETTELRRGLADLSAAEVATALRVLDRLGEEFRHLASGSGVASKEPGVPGSSGTNGDPDSSGIRRSGADNSQDTPPPSPHKGQHGE